MALDPIFQQHLDGKRRAVAQARKQLEKAQKHLETVEAELRGWEQAAEAMLRPPNSQSDGVPKRGLSDRWKSVIGEMAAIHPKDFSLSDVAILTDKHGLKLSPDTLRGQMHHYVSESKFLERTTPGRFRVTLDGAVAAGVSLGGGADDDDAIPF